MPYNQELKALKYRNKNFGPAIEDLDSALDILNVDLGEAAMSESKFFGVLNTIYLDIAEGNMESLAKFHISVSKLMPPALSEGKLKKFAGGKERI